MDPRLRRGVQVNLNLPGQKHLETGVPQALGKDEVTFGPYVTVGLIWSSQTKMRLSPTARHSGGLQAAGGEGSLGHGR